MSENSDSSNRSNSSDGADGATNAQGEKGDTGATVRTDHGPVKNPDATINDLNAVSGRTAGVTSFEPKVGDRVTVNGALAELQAYNRETDIFTAILKVGGGSDRITGHISNTRIEKLDGGKLVQDASELDGLEENSRWVSDPEQEGIENGVTRVNAEYHDDVTEIQTNSFGEHGSK